MRIMQRLFGRNGGDEIPMSLTALSTGIQATIDDITNKVFTLYSPHLLAQSATYVAPAVWGSDKDGELTDSQVEMNHLIAPAIDDALRMFNPVNLTLQQAYAIRCLFCGLVVSRIIFMIELAKNHGADQDEPPADEEPAGMPAAAAFPRPGVSGPRSPDA